MQGKGLRLSKVLPQHSLESVKELKLFHYSFDDHFHDQISPWQQWPMAWNQLTALTSLSCQLYSYDKSLVPAVLNQMTSLRKLDVSLDFGESDEIGFDLGEEDYKAYKAEAVDKVIENTRGLTRLTSLMINGSESIALRSA